MDRAVYLWMEGRKCFLALMRFNSSFMDCYVSFPWRLQGRPGEYKIVLVLSLPEWELGWMPLQRETLDPDSMDRTTMMFGFNSKFNPPTHRFVFALVPFYCKTVKSSKTYVHIDAMISLKNIPSNISAVYHFSNISAVYHFEEDYPAAYSQRSTHLWISTWEIDLCIVCNSFCQINVSNIQHFYQSFEI